jgi:TolB-like protein
MDPSEVADLLRRDNLDPADASRLPSAQRIGRLLQVSHVLQGSVTEYRYKPGLSETPAVGVTARLIDVASGEVVWTSSHARLGSSWLREDGLARVAQQVAHDMAAHLTASLGDARAR